MELCEICKLKKCTESFYHTAGGMYDMPEFTFSFKKVCKICRNWLCVAKSDLNVIAVQYHLSYRNYKSYKSFLSSNVQMNNNKFYKSNPISRNGIPVLVGDRYHEIKKILDKTK